MSGCGDHVEVERRMLKVVGCMVEVVGLGRLGDFVGHYHVHNRKGGCYYYHC